MYNNENLILVILPRSLLGQIIAEKTSGNITVYIYDASGTPIGMQYRGASYASGVWDIYWYEKNLFGDIVAVYDHSGTKRVSYIYDAWGNFTTAYHNGTTSSSQVAKNPFRYRGYYYDQDLALYYLQTRYYDSNTGRFINADSVDYLGENGDINSYNLFAYCSNNPIMFIDPSGHGIFTTFLVALAFGFVLPYANDVYDEIESDGFQWKDLKTPLIENGKQYTVNVLENLVVGFFAYKALTIGKTAFQQGIRISTSKIFASLGKTMIYASSAGSGIYAFETLVLKNGEFETSEFFKRGLFLGIEATANNGLGMLMGNQGFSTGKFNGIKGIAMRSYLKTPIIFPLNLILKSLRSEE